MNDIETNKATFKKLISDSVHRDGIGDLMNWLETTDFYRAPSSARFHSAEPGGLCAHSLTVYNCLKEMQDTESDETIAIASLFHDLCKVNFYKESHRNVKDESGKWIQVPSYDYADDELPFGHGEKSMYILMKYIKLTDEEALAIRWHMSSFYAANPGESQALAAALSKSRLVLKLQMCDTAAAFWYGK